MLEQNQRKMVEGIKDSGRLEIRARMPGGADITLTFDNAALDIRKLRHDVALAIQDFYNQYNEKERWKQCTDGNGSMRITGCSGRSRERKGGAGTSRMSSMPNWRPKGR